MQATITITLTREEAWNLASDLAELCDRWSTDATPTNLLINALCDVLDVKPYDL